MLRRVSVLLAVVLGALAAASIARADGDPASDVLYTGTLFASYSSPANGANGDELRGLLKAATARGLPLKVALVSDTRDLGQYPKLFSDPQRYADLLASELAIYKPLKAPVIVVTPNGIAAAGREPKGTRFVELSHARGAQLLQGLGKPSASDGETLAASAIVAVRQVAREEGHPLPEHVTPIKSGSTTTVGAKKKTSPWLLVGGVAALFFAAWLAFEIVAAVRERRRAATGSNAPD